jgi:hypothetical protein
MDKLRNREYELNKLTMNKISFLIYKIGIYLSDKKSEIKNRLESGFRGEIFNRSYFFSYDKFHQFSFQFYEKDEEYPLRLTMSFLGFYLSINIGNELSDNYNYNDNDSSWGFYYYVDTHDFVIRNGKKSKYIPMPWALTWVRTSMLKKNGEWEHEVKGNRKDFYEEKWNDILFSETHPYKYKLKSGKVQNTLATIKVKEMEWRRVGWKWSKMGRLVRKTIEVDFKNELGEGSGSWKGGVVGCGYEMLKNETPLDTLKRMERDRKL